MFAITVYYNSYWNELIVWKSYWLLYKVCSINTGRVIALRLRILQRFFWYFEIIITIGLYCFFVCCWKMVYLMILCLFLLLLFLFFVMFIIVFCLISLLLFVLFDFTFLFWSLPLVFLSILFYVLSWVANCIHHVSVIRKCLVNQIK